MFFEASKAGGFAALDVQPIGGLERSLRGRAEIRKRVETATVDNGGALSGFLYDFIVLFCFLYFFGGFEMYLLTDIINDCFVLSLIS